VSLRDEQRRELISLLTQETKPSRRPSSYGAQILLLPLGRLPAEKLNRIFDAHQLQNLHQQLTGFQRMEPMLTDLLSLDLDDPLKER
jgi:hypothetical protein